MLLGAVMGVASGGMPQSCMKRIKTVCIDKLINIIVSANTAQNNNKRSSPRDDVKNVNDDGTAADGNVAKKQKQGSNEF